MDCPIFINELSMDVACNIHDAKASATQFVECIISISNTRKNIRIFHFGKISTLCINSQFTMASLITSKDKWERLRLSYVDASSIYSDVIKNIEEEQYLSILGHASRGALMSLLHSPAMLSFNINNNYLSNKINCEYYSICNDVERTDSIDINNISKLQHVENYSSDILDFGYLSSKSPTIYSNTDYIVQMYSNDHNPPHIHVYDASENNTTLARININNFDLMDGSEKIQPIRKNVMEWVRVNQQFLLENWELCRQGKYPRIIG
ncbi:DUF4160 domain-containing protein [Hafnia paralvei]|uniref:DUF4160 domain-containing protein n=1 Tax=Hafnia paralvei TaxID=546367 RepID=UPI003CEC4409